MMDNYEVESVSGSVFYKMADQVEGNLWGPWDPAYEWKILPSVSSR